MEKVKNWKDTLLMPKTNFPMKANLVEKEPLYLQKWTETKVYQKVLRRNKGNQRFVLHDGPAYANGSLHLGHALNKILKDIVVRRKNLEGFYAPFVPGWDTHGLPIENKMLQESGMTKDDLDKVTLRKKAQKYAWKQVENQRNQFLKLQLLSDFQSKYLTLDREYVVGQLKLFKKMALEGMVYKGLKPVYWSPSSQSALAEAEVEYQEHVSPEIIVALRVTEPNRMMGENSYLLIMTTTPWTLVANAAVAVNKDFEYAKVKVQDKNFVVAAEQVAAVAKKAKWKDFQIVQTFLGKDLIGTKYQKPVQRSKTGFVVEGHHVEKTTGTALVHIAPLFGQEDYLIGKKNNLEMVMHVDDKGFFNHEAGQFANLFYQDANKAIGTFLDQQQELVSLSFLKHSYPHDWRTHKPVIYRGVPQWFVNVAQVKPKILSELDKVSFYPDWGKTKLAKMIKDREEWNISRQRSWGVPITIFYDQNQTPQLREELFDYVITQVKQRGLDIWWTESTDNLLPPKHRNQKWTREMDIMDVWFDSGSSSISVQVEGESAPFDLYLEGSDQYRGWFNSSLINSVAYSGKTPFKQVVSHGFVLDEKMNKMSKSRGNVVDPIEFIHKNGAEVLRLWVANLEYTKDIGISNSVIAQTKEIYRRIRNTFRFMLGNLRDFSRDENHVKPTGMHKYIYQEVKNNESLVNTAYDNFKFGEVVKLVNNLFVKLSSWYFDYAKDVLYCENGDNLERRMIQSNIYETIQFATKSLAPVLPTTIEEVYNHCFYDKNKQESFFLEDFTFTKERWKQDKLFELFDKEQRPHANKLLESSRKNGIIRRNNEATLHVKISPENRVGNEQTYQKYLMVAKVVFDKAWKVVKDEGFKKCQRCWNHFEPSSLTAENICFRCTKVVNHLR